ncbi:retrotransposon protein, putative, ty1-copia subclass [Tanacetum coccineum]
MLVKHPIPAALVPAHVGQQVAPETLAAHAAWVNGIQVNEVPKKENPSTDSICYQCGDTGQWKMNFPQYLAELLRNKKLSQGASGSGIYTTELYTFPNKSWVYDIGCGTHIYNTTQGLKGSRKLKPRDLSLYVGNGQRVAVEVIRSFHLCLPSGLVIVLNNCHYDPSITRRIISVSCLYDDGFVNSFVDNAISVSRNNLVYFSAVLRDNGMKTLYTSSGKGQDLLGLIHTDVCGPFRTLSRQGASYFITFTNEDYALETAARILNMVPTKKVENTPYEVWHKQAPKLSYLKVWGCEALVKRDTLTKPDKLKPRSIECIFVGYPKETMGYSFYYPPENKVIVARNVEFLENSLITQEASGSLEDLEIIQEEDTHPSINTSSHHEEDDLEINEPQSDIIPIRRSIRTRHALDRMCLYVDAEEHELGDPDEPATYKAALLDLESDKWLNAINVEMQSMKDNKVLVLYDLPPNCKTIGSKWLFKKKTDIDGVVHTYKARLVAKGFTQTYRVDYEETFSLVANIRAIRILIAIAAYYNYEIWQMDVKNAFLNGHLLEEIYIEQPEGFVNLKYSNRVCKLKRSIYGLKQASRK